MKQAMLKMMASAAVVVAGAPFLMAASADAQAIQTITFGGLPFGNPAVTTYSENGLTFAVTAGTFTGTSGNGVPPPSVYTSTGSGMAQVTSGGLFNFSSIALGNGAFSGTAQFTISGLLNNVSLFTFDEAVGALSFNTYQSPTADATTAIDTLRIAATGDANVDNIAVRTIAAMTSAVPEVSTWAMLMVGLGMVGGSLRRRRSVSARVSFA